MHVREVPSPALRSGGVIVRNEFSLISAGTERSTVQRRKENILSKVRWNPDQVKIVLDQIKQQEVWSVYRNESLTIDKGYKTDVEEFIHSVHLGIDFVPIQSLVATTRAALKIIESLETGLPVAV